jgi:hypothetical protein
MRQPLSEFRILLPVWGKRYVEQFLDFCLPTLLADGNLPSLCRRGACTFVLFARAKEIEAIRRNRFWQALQRLCAVETIAIDDLISDSHSTTLTLAYVRGIRSCKSGLLNTCFIFLVSDYVLADGALNKAVSPVVAGASGVLVGNLQMTSEEAASVLLQARADKLYLSIKPRDLARLSLDHTHPATLASFVDSTVSHDASSNRLFWRVDDSTVLGRFYLMHMIAIRPETADFTIAAPSDYSLIPELCPSGAVTIIEDSDEYCVVEMQPGRTAEPNLRLGPMTPQTQAASLRRWATRQHRINAQHAVVFHSGEIGSALPETIAKSRGFIDKVEQRLPAIAQPFRYHPYWYGAVEHHDRTSPVLVDFSVMGELLGDPNFTAAIRSPRSIRLRAALFGRAPDFRPWHPLWPDVRRFWKALGAISDGASIVVVGDIPARLRPPIDVRAQASGARRVSHIALRDLNHAANRAVSHPQDPFDVCVLILSHDSWENWRPKVEQSASLIGPTGRILLVVGDIFDDAIRTFNPDALSQLRGSPPSGLRLEDFSVVKAGSGRLWTQSMMMARARSFFGGDALSKLLTMVSAAALATVNAGLNVSAILRPKAHERAQCSSVFLTLRLESPQNHDARSTPADK